MHIYAQVVDDSTNNTIASSSSNDKDIEKEISKCNDKVSKSNLVGKHLAENIISLRENEDLTAFKFVDRGEMLSMGIGEATITGMGLTISGSLAFQLRRMTYLSKFPNLTLSVKSAGSWLLGYGKKLF